MVSIMQGSFTGGELSPNLYSRTDLERWRVSLKLCRNFIVQPYGGVQNRPGTRYIATAKAQCRLVAFKSSSNLNYVLEFSNNCIRIFLAGVPVYSTGTTPLEVTTTYTLAQLADLKFSQSVDVLTITHPSHAPANLSRYGALDWRLADINFTTGPFLDLNLDPAAALFASVGRGVATITSTKALFTSDHVNRLVYIESRNFGQPWEVGARVVAGNERRSDGKYYKALNDGITGTLRPSHYVGAWSDGTVNWEYQHAGYGIAKITAVATTSLAATATVLSLLPDSLVSEGFRDPIATTAAASADVATGCTILTTSAHSLAVVGVAVATYSNGALGAVMIKSYPATTTILIDTPYTTYAASGLTIAHIQAPIATETAQASDRWAFGAWGGSQGFPAVSTYYQGRKAYAASTLGPQTVWMSRTNSYDDFGFSAPMQDDDPVTFTLASPRYDTICGFQILERLAIFTTGGEWWLGAGQTDITTPSSISMKPISNWGSNSMEPLAVGDAAFFVQAKGSVVRNLTADGNSSNLIVLADHLFEGKSVVGWAYQQNPFGIIWAVRNDGTLLGLTYMREQNVAGWHQHRTIGGTFESVCCVSETFEGELQDAVYLSVKRGSSWFIERLNSRRVSGVSGAFFVDSGKSVDISSAVATLTGLGHLVGQTVDVHLDLVSSAYAFTAVVSSGGYVYLEGPVGGGALNKAFVGLPILADLQTLDIAQSSNETLVNKKKAIRSVGLQVVSSGLSFAGRDVSNLFEIQGLSEPTLGYNAFVSGTFPVDISTSWGIGGSVWVQQSYSYPITITSIIPEVEIGGV